MKCRTRGDGSSAGESTSQPMRVSASVANIDVAAGKDGKLSTEVAESEPKAKQTTATTVPNNTEPRISYNSISNVGDVVLFFQVNTSQGGNTDSSTYMAFHDGRSKNHFLDLNCVEALRDSKHSSTGLPKYYIGVVIYTEKMAASATQNPFHLAEGTEFTVITAQPIESVYSQGFGQGCPLAQESNSVSDSVKISFRSFQPGDTVLCLPTKAFSGVSARTPRNRKSSNQFDETENADEKSLSAATADIRMDDVTYVAFSDKVDASLYIASPESVAEFKRKDGVNRLTFLLGRIVRISKLEDEVQCSGEDKASSQPSTMAERIEARRKGRKKTETNARFKKDRFYLTLAAL